MGERAQIEKFLSELRGNDVVWDVGAHMGMYSIFAAIRLKRGGGEVVSFEPEPSARQLLRRNCSINNLRNVQILPYGLGEEETHAILRRPEVSGGATVDSQRTLGYELDPQRIDIRRGDRLVEQGIAAPDVVKMDVEGAEFAALRGMSGLLSRCRVLLVEVHTESKVEDASVAARVRRLLGSRTFDIKVTGTRGSQEHWMCRRPSASVDSSGGDDSW